MPGRNRERQSAPGFRVVPAQRTGFPGPGKHSRQCTSTTRFRSTYPGNNHEMSAKITWIEETGIRMRASSTAFSGVGQSAVAAPLVSRMSRMTQDNRRQGTAKKVVPSERCLGHACVCGRAPVPHDRQGKAQIRKGKQFGCRARLQASRGRCPNMNEPQNQSDF